MAADSPLDPDGNVTRFLIAAGYRAHELAPLHMGTRLFHDLGLYGDSSDDVMAMLQNKFGIDLSDFPFDRYFPPEFEGKTRFQAFLLNLRMPLQSRLIRDRTKFEPLTLQQIDDAMRAGRWLPRSSKETTCSQ
ncbi:DUF1493 family protein [Tardiphaga sp. 839_C3_N1_4]|uniref:DUF1493 family protein n=1 Tax=Tardiphaga sp. 839_C3_N1_4 TaxID=3240761 RepID=UPI003F266637